MGNRFHSLFSSEPRNPELVKTEPISTKSKDRIFKSERLSAAIKYNKTDVKEGSDKFSKNEANMELLSRQTTAISREAMKETLIKWEKELSLDPSIYSDLRDLFKVANNDYWPNHVLDIGRDSPWETMQDNTARTNWLYFYVSRTGADSNTQTFNVAICHLITKEPNISRNVLIGGLRKKNLNSRGR